MEKAYDEQREFAAKATTKHTEWSYLHLEAHSALPQPYPLSDRRCSGKPPATLPTRSRHDGTAGALEWQRNSSLARDEATSEQV